MSGSSIHTHYLKINPLAPQQKYINLAAAVLKKGKLVAFPTETVYGLGANALDPKAILEIFKAKGRPADNPLIVHVARPAEVQKLTAAIPEVARRLMSKFWPGPLTLVLPKSATVPDLVTAGLDTVAIRMPAHPVALALLEISGLAIAAPSANLSGSPSPTTGFHVLQDLGGKIEVILDSGSTMVGVESTVLDVTTPVPMILRPGGVTKEELEQELGMIMIDPAVVAAQLPDSVPRSPGMKYTHYAPRATTYLVTGALPHVVNQIKKRISVHHRRGQRVGVLATGETANFYQHPPRPDHLEILGWRTNLTLVAAQLYAALRNCDEQKVDLIFSETFPEAGIGLAVMNRLRKAAGYRIIEV